MSVKTIIVALALVVLSGAVRAEEYHVTVDGADDPNRDGLTRETAWASLAFACDQVPDDGEAHTILVRAGSYEATRTAFPKSNTSIIGEGAGGNKKTEIVASREWELSEE
ncbi:MAG: hypothetical protein AAGC68_15460, partial [Verrucomicrobiota bacterium]